jgi:hypothetical protein
MKAETFSKETIKRIELFCRKSINLCFPIDFKLNHIVGIDEIENIFRMMEDGYQFPRNKQKYEERIQEQFKILAEIGITDNASAIAYLDKLELQLELWAKIKADFDSETEARLKELQQHFLEKNR